MAANLVVVLGDKREVSGCVLITSVHVEEGKMTPSKKGQDWLMSD